MYILRALSLSLNHHLARPLAIFLSDLFYLLWSISSYRNRKRWFSTKFLCSVLSTTLYTYILCVFLYLLFKVGTFRFRYVYKMYLSRERLKNYSLHMRSRTSTLRSDSKQISLSEAKIFQEAHASDLYTSTFGCLLLSSYHQFIITPHHGVCFKSVSIVAVGVELVGRCSFC